MQIPLKEFERSINGTILARGLNYFRSGRVHNPVELKSGVYEFIVEGTEDYTVQISLKDGIVNEFVCNCPYDMGPVCKHVAAAMYYLQQDEPANKPKAIKKKGSGKKRQKTVMERVDELLDKATPAEIKQFIREKTEQDRMFRNIFLTTFARYNTDESKSMYIEQIKSILYAAADRDGFIDWRTAGGVARDVDMLLETARQQIDLKNFKSAFYISTAVMEKMTEAIQYADDSNGEIGGCVDAGFELLRQLAQKRSDEKTRQMVLEYCFSAFDKEIYKGWGWHIDLLQTAASLIKTDAEFEKLMNQIEQAQDSDFSRELAQSIKYEVLLKIKGAAEADTFLEQHLTNPRLRQKAIQNACKQKKYDKANKLAEEGVKYDAKDKPGLVVDWYNWLLKIAQAQKNTEKIIEYARYLLIDSYRRDQDYYKVLKKHVQPEDWKAFIEDVIKDIIQNKRRYNTDLIAEIYIREEWWDRLLEVVKQFPDLRTIENYERYLSENYADQLVELYAKGIMEYIENNVGRKHYQTACRYLRRMIKLGGREEADRVISALRENYPSRRALQEELLNV